MQKSALKTWMKWAGLTVVLLLCFSFVAAHAQDLTSGGSGLSIEAATEGATVSEAVSRQELGPLITNIVNYFIGFLGFLAIIVLVYAGVLMVLNLGNEEAITKSKKIMTYAAIGLVVIIMSGAIVRFITGSAGEGVGGECKPNAAQGEEGSCPSDQYCAYDVSSQSYQCKSYATRQCLDSRDCGPDEWCQEDFTCASHTPPGSTRCEAENGTQGSCESDEICWYGVCTRKSAEGEPCTEEEGCPEHYECINEICRLAYGGQSWGASCVQTRDCQQGEYCSAEKQQCVRGQDLTCSAERPCPEPKQCDEYGLCRNPNAGSGSICQDNTDCYTGYVCNMDKKRCEYQGSGLGEGVTGSPAIAASEERLAELDRLLADLMAELDGLSDDIDGLPGADRDHLLGILGQGTLADKMAGVKTILDATDDPAVARVLERVLSALERLEDLREELDALREVMPESEATIKAWNEVSEALNTLIDDPLSTIKLQRFESRYRTLNSLLRQFPFVQAIIHAAPAEGNVPFTVTLDALDSIDPTGGTISDYKWSYLDNKGSEVSLGADPVIVHDFTEPNTYAVKLAVSTAQKDKAGYKTAADGVSVVRIKANPAASKVAFRINGVEASDVYHATEKEGAAGIAFDPGPTVPAVGKVIQKYEWMYGDTATEERSVPTTVIHTYSKPGEYTVILKVTDNHGVVDRKVVKLYIKSLAADIRITPKDGNVNTEFHFQGLDSRSDDGTIKKYEWSVEDFEGNVAARSEEQNFYHKFERPGQYRIILLVTDTPGSKDKHLTLLNVHSRPPVASFSYSIPQANHPNAVEFDAMNSYDPDQGDRITYSWDFDGDGIYDVVDSTEIKTSFTYKRIGEYKAVLQVEDSFGQIHSISKGVTVNSVLSGDIVMEKKAGQVGEEMEFKAVSPNAVAYLWEFGDGETASTEEDKITYTYKKKGKYKVKLNFFDDEDNVNSDYAYMLAGDRDTPIAVATAFVNSREPALMENLCGQGKDGIIVTRADSILLTAKDALNRDGSSRMLSYDWRFSDGSASSRKEFNHKFDEINRESDCFSVSLAVRDQVSGKVSDEDTLYFHVVNQLPAITDFVIMAPLSQAKELVTPSKIHLKAVNPKDTDGQIKKYRWWYYREGNEDEKLGVHSTGTPETDIVITAEGSPDVTNRYFFIAEITDNDNGVYSSTERFGELSYLDVKNGPNLSPVAEFTMDKTTIAVGDSITFISNAYDPQGDTLPSDAFRWDFDGDGEFDDVTSGPQVSRQFNTPGEYDVRLKVVYRGLSSSVAKKIFVEPTNSLPQAAFTYKISGDTVSFDGSNSRYDPDLEDNTLRFEWDFDIEGDANGNGIKDDDAESTEPNPTHTYPVSGIYRIRLKVKDALGMEGVVVREVNLAMDQAQREKNTKSSIAVTSPSQPLTSLNVVLTPMEIMKNGTADIEASVLNADNSPYYGQVFFEVMEGSGNFTPNPVDAKESKAATIFSPVDSGTIRVRVRATGTYYGELTEDVILKVK
ncbi:PKD domain-containing protein [Candidatus Peregrinibacteria bacterium]|nr:PKD domain-containing protein [Candidatus Peregrinibacteria bacterium]